MTRTTQLTVMTGLLLALSCTKTNSTPTKEEASANQTPPTTTSTPSAGSESRADTPAQESSMDQFQMPANTTSTPSGLKYVVLQEGTGPQPKRGQSVNVHYTGWLTNGTEFDSSRDGDSPLSFRVGAGEVIQGWDEGVGAMKIGEKRTLVIPPELGYGQSGSGSVIPPNATLVFNVELVGVQ